MQVVHKSDAVQRSMMNKIDRRAVLLQHSRLSGERQQMYASVPDSSKGQPGEGVAQGPGGDAGEET